MFEFKDDVNRNVDNEITTKYGTLTLKKASQNAPYRLYKKVFKSKLDKILLNELNNIVRKYYPNYSDREVEQMYINLKQSGCTYASIANTILNQLGSDVDLIQQYFGYNLFNSDGIIISDKLALDIFACMSNMVELKVSKYDKRKFDSLLEGANSILNQSFDNETDAIMALNAVGWVADGMDDDKKLIFRSIFCHNEIYLGTYSEIAQELFGINDLTMDKNKLEQLLKDYDYQYTFRYLDQPSKFAGFGTIKANNYNKWMNKYFEVNNINLGIQSVEIGTKNIDYNSFVDDVFAKINDGYSIEVGVGPRSPVWITRGKKTDWDKPTSDKAGHRMNFEGFDQDGNILVCSWGETYVIPKEFYQDLEVDGLKLFEVNRSLDNSKRSR